MILILYTLILFVIIWFMNRWRVRASIKLSKKVPSSSWHTLFGFGHLVTVRNALRKLWDHGKIYGSNSILWMGPFPVFFTTDPENLKIILTSKNCVNKPMEFYKGLICLAGPGLITDNDPVWNLHRKLLNKAFSHKNIMALFPTFHEEVNKFINELKESVEEGEDWNMLVRLRRLTLRNGTRTILKRDIDLTKFSSATMAIHFDRLVMLMCHYVLYPVLTYNWLRNILEPRLFKNAIESVHKFTNFLKDSLNVVRQNDTEDKSFLPHEHSVIDCCINIAGQLELAEDEVHGLLMHLFVASFETSSTTLYLALVLLAMYPEYQDRAYEEVDNILNDSETELTLKQLDDLTYLDMVFNETMRVMPVVPFVLRKVSKQDVVLNKDITLPVGQIIGIDIFSLHRSKTLWGPEAENFNPDNFLPANVAARHPYAFIPFTKGQRFCIGWRYASLFFKMSLAKLIKSFKFSTDFKYHNMRFENHVTLKLVEEPQLKIERRNVNQ